MRLTNFAPVFLHLLCKCAGNYKVVFAILGENGNTITMTTHVIHEQDIVLI